MWSELNLPKKPNTDKPRAKPNNVKNEVIDKRGFKHLRLAHEHPCASRQDKPKTPGPLFELE
jgi:hypothetical protein